MTAGLSTRTPERRPQRRRTVRLGPVSGVVRSRQLLLPVVALVLLVLVGAASIGRGDYPISLVDVLRTLVGAFPVGTLVRLQRGQLAVVIDEVATDPLSPRVRMFRHADTDRDMPPVVIETRDNPVVSVERAAGLSIDDAALATLIAP